MKKLLAVLLSVPLFAQTPVPELAEWLTGTFDVGYRWNTGVGGSLETYRSIVNLGSGPKLLGTEFTLVDPKKRIFDRLDFRAYDWGGDPYSSLHLRAKKAKLYDLNADYRNIVYFNNLPSYADPLLSRGIVLNEQSSDTHRRFTSVQIDALPGNWLVPYLALDRDSDTGTGVNAYITGGNEYATPTTVRNAVNTYRGGLRLELRRFHATLEQGGTTFKDDQNVYTSAGINYGNNITPLLGHSLDLTGLSQAYGIRGTSIYTKALITASATPWLDLYGQVLYSRPDTGVRYQEYATGNLADLSTLQFFTGQQYLLSAESKLPHTSASVGAEIRPMRRVRILPSWLTDRLSGSSSVAASLFGQTLATNYNQEQVDVMVDISSKLMLRAGYRFVWGNSSNAILPTAELTALEQGTLRRNTGIAGLTYRPTQNLSFNGELEAAESGGTYFRTSLYNYWKLRLRARYRVTPSLQFSADSNILNNQNPTDGIHYDYLAHAETLGLSWSPGAKWNLQGSYTRSSVRSDISYLIPQVLLPERDLYRDNNHSISALMEGGLPSRFGVKARFSAGGSLHLSSGSRPTKYLQPFGKVTVPVNKQLEWVSEWRYYGFGETFSIFENFRTHLIATGLRYTR